MRGKEPKLKKTQSKEELDEEGKKTGCLYIVSSEIDRKKKEKTQRKSLTTTNSTSKSYAHDYVSLSSPCRCDGGISKIYFASNFSFLSLSSLAYVKAGLASSNFLLTDRNFCARIKRSNKLSSVVSFHD